MNVRKTITTSAIALGVLAGSAGIASAVNSQGSTAQPETSVDDEREDPKLNGSVQSPEIEGQSEAEESAALQALATITADDASKAALAANPGATLDGVELENENGSVVYEVELTDATGAAIEVKVDAGNGAVLAQESGDDEDDEDEANEGSEVDEAPEVTPAN